MQIEESAVAKLICICPTERDHRELAALSNGHSFLHHDYATSALEDLTARDGMPAVSIENPEREVQLILNRCHNDSLQGVITTDDYPGTTMASVVASELNLPGPRPQANLSECAKSNCYPA
jgi:hypothetical protein